MLKIPKNSYSSFISSTTTFSSNNDARNGSFLNSIKKTIEVGGNDQDGRNIVQEHLRSNIRKRPDWTSVSQVDVPNAVILHG